MKKLAFGITAGLLLALPLGTARAQFVSGGSGTFSGGIGVNNTLLTIQNNPTEAGCVSFGGVLGATLSAGVCTGSSADVKTGASQTQTRTLSETGVTAASNFGIVLNAVEPAGGPITLNTLAFAIYSPTGTVLYTATATLNQTFASTFTGTGNSGYLFTLNAATQTAATAAGAFSNTNNVIGLSSSLSGSAGGNETFFVANSGGLSTVVPEPSTYALMAAGLLAVGFVRRRRRTA